MNTEQLEQFVKNQMTEHWNFVAAALTNYQERCRWDSDDRCTSALPAIPETIQSYSLLFLGRLKEVVESMAAGAARPLVLSEE